MHSKTKDDVKVRMDMIDICKQSGLNLKHVAIGKTLKPKASLDKRKGMCELAQQLTMPDAYCFNIRNYVDMKSAKFQTREESLLSYVLQTLMSIAFCALLDDVLEPLIGLSEYFRSPCSTVLRSIRYKKCNGI